MWLASEREPPCRRSPRALPFPQIKRAARRRPFGACEARTALSRPRPAGLRVQGHRHDLSACRCWAWPDLPTSPSDDRKSAWRVRPSA